MGKRKDGSRGPIASNYKNPKCIIGVDQSYRRTGITIAVDGKIKVIRSIDFKHVQTKTGKRLLLQKTLRKALDKCVGNYGPDDVAVICERVRTFTGGGDLRPSVIKAASAMTAYIVDTAMEYGIKTWSVDTRAWKVAILGTSRPSVENFPGVKNPQKVLAVKKVISLGFENSIKKITSKGSFFDDDAADSACIALYGFVKNPKLNIEQ